MSGSPEELVRVAEVARESGLSASRVRHLAEARAAIARRELRNSSASLTPQGRHSCQNLAEPETPSVESG